MSASQFLNLDESCHFGQSRNQIFDVASNYKTYQGVIATVWLADPISTE